MEEDTFSAKIENNVFFNTSKDLNQGFFQLDNNLTEKSLPTRQNLKYRSSIQLALNAHSSNRKCNLDPMSKSFGLVWFVMFECQEAAVHCESKKRAEGWITFCGKEGFCEEERSNDRRREVSIMAEKGKSASCQGENSPMDWAGNHQDFSPRSSSKT
uniref:Uncharacterized protein n=1 Tax=Salix viminalis TaxID=40686 RepID=A0A6N2LPZ6_SALVM